MLLTLDGEAVTRLNLTTLLKPYAPGDTVPVTFSRRGTEQTVQLTLPGGGNLQYTIEPIDQPTALQEAINKDWLQIP